MMKRYLLVLALLLSVQGAFAQSFLREDTASQIIMMGPFVDDVDGNTEETGLTISNTDVLISKNGATGVAKNSGGCTHDADGMYNCTLNATDTSTVGRLAVWIHEGGALFVKRDFQVLEEAVYDRDYVAASTGIIGTAQTSDAPTVQEIWDHVIDGALDAEEALCYLAAILVNESDFDDVGADSVEFMNAAGTTPKVTVTYSGTNGQDRSAVTLAACGS